MYSSYSLNLDVDDSMDDIASNYHHGNTRVDELLPRGIGNQNMLILWAYDGNRKKHNERQAGQDPTGQATLGGIDPQLPSQPETIANDRSRFVEDFRQVPARFLLHQNGGHQESNVRQRDAIG